MWFKSECNRISECLWEYVSQRLSTAETAQVESHLQQCARCQAEAEAYRQTITMLGAARRLPVPTSQTTWRDLRPSLATSRLPAPRSIDLLPRLTLAGAGAALAAMLLVVFWSGGHRSPLSGNPALGSSGRQQTAPSDPAKPSPTDSALAQDSTDRRASDSAMPGSLFGSWLPIAPALLQTTPVEEPKSVSTPKLSPHHRIYHGVRLAVGGHNMPVATPEDAVPQLDGDNVSPRSQHNYVLSPVSTSTEDETAHHYVIGSIPVSQGGGMVASNDGTEEGRAW